MRALIILGIIISLTGCDQKNIKTPPSDGSNIRVVTKKIYSIKKYVPGIRRVETSAILALEAPYEFRQESENSGKEYTVMEMSPHYLVTKVTKNYKGKDDYVGFVDILIEDGRGIYACQEFIYDKPNKNAPDPQCSFEIVGTIPIEQAEIKKQ